VIELGVLVLAMLSSTRWYQRIEAEKELYNRLGMHPYKYVGMPFVGGRTVLTFPDGTQIVQLITQEDFAIVGTSMNDQYLGGSDMGIDQERSGDSPLFRSMERGTIKTFIYLDERSVPKMKVWFLREDTTGIWESGAEVGWLKKEGDRFDMTTVLSSMPDELRDKLVVFWLGLEPYLKESALELVADSHDEKSPSQSIRYLQRCFLDNLEMEDYDEYRYNREYFMHVLSEDGTDEWEDYLLRAQDQVFKDANKLMDIVRRDLGLLVQDRLGRSQWHDYKVGVPDTIFALPKLQLRLRIAIRFPDADWLWRNRIKDQGEDSWFSHMYQFKEPLVAWELYSAGGELLGTVPYREGPLGLFRKFMHLDEYLARWGQSLADEVEEIKRDVPHSWVVDPSTLLPIH
jgi:hypothetical protein